MMWKLVAARTPQPGCVTAQSQHSHSTVTAQNDVEVGCRTHPAAGMLASRIDASTQAYTARHPTTQHGRAHHCDKITPIRCRTGGGGEEGGGWGWG